MPLTLTRADSPEINVRALNQLAQRLAEGRGCAFCTARRMLCETRELLTKIGAAPTPEIRDFEEVANDYLEHEPGATDCSVCLRAREAARAFLGHDDPPPGAPCHRHAVCAKHGGTQ